MPGSNEAQLRKKVLVLDFNDFYGGGQKFISDLNFLLHTEIDFYFAIANIDLVGQLRSDNILKTTPSVLNIIKNIKNINRYIEENQIECLILNGNRSIYCAPFLTSCKKIAYKHTGNNALGFYKRLLIPIVLNTCYLFCNKVVVLYEKARSEVWFDKKVRVIQNTVFESDEQQQLSFGMRNPSLPVRVAMISRLDENKGIFWLLRCLLKIPLSIRSKLQLFIAGDGPLKNDLQKFIYDNNLSGQVNLLGFVNNVSMLMGSVDVFVLPSKFEAFPLSILDALRHSLPIIATATGGIPEMVSHGKNGFLLKYNSDEDLIYSLNYLVINEKDRKKMGQESEKVFLSKFNNIIFKNRILKLLTDET